MKYRSTRTPCFLILLLSTLSTLPALSADTPPATSTAPATRPALTLDAKTTLITEPVNPDGTPNYLAALDAELAKAVTPENNAAIPLLRALGPKAIFDEKLRPLILQKLKLDLPEAGPYFIDLPSYARQQHAAGPDAATPFNDDATSKAQDATLKKTWNPKDFPIIAAWLDANKQPLAQITEASHLPRLCYPLVSAKTPPSLMDATVPASGRLRSAANALSTRAMLLISTGDSAAARADTLTIHRLARFEAQSQFTIRILIAFALDALASQDEQVLLRSPALTAADAQALLKDLRNLPELRSTFVADSHAERYVGLDLLMPAVRGHSDETLQMYTVFAGPDFPTPPPVPAHTLDQADWNVVLRAVNRRYDQLDAATSLSLMTERHDAFQPLIREQQAAGVPPAPFGLLEAAAPTASHEVREQRSKRYLAELGQFLSRRADESVPEFSHRVALFLTRVDPFEERYPILLDRATAEYRLTLLAAALAVYHADHAQYPQTLDPLKAPAYLPAIPLDPFTAKPFIYRPTAEGYILYSIGDNGQDDGGKDRTAGGDEIVMHIP